MQEIYQGRRFLTVDMQDQRTCTKIAMKELLLQTNEFLLMLIFFYTRRNLHFCFTDDIMKLKIINSYISLKNDSWSVWYRYCCSHICWICFCSFQEVLNILCNVFLQLWLQFFVEDIPNMSSWASRWNLYWRLKRRFGVEKRRFNILSSYPQLPRTLTLKHCKWCK